MKALFPWKPADVSAVYPLPLCDEVFLHRSFSLPHGHPDLCRGGTILG